MFFVSARSVFRIILLFHQFWPEVYEKVLMNKIATERNEEYDSEQERANCILWLCIAFLLKGEVIR